MTDIRDWIGKREEAEDVVTPEPLARLTAMLDHDRPPWPDGELPPFGHWLFCLPRVPQREIGPDGHPRRGGFLPPVTLARRMWAGGSLDFVAPIRIGERIRRLSTIADVTQKTGRSGDLVFVKVVHEISTERALAVREEQDLVYRDMPNAAASATAESPVLPAAQWQRTVNPDPVLLFRFSALTFNGHRIHYDRDYCREVEGYSGLVVHAPLTATLVMDLLLRNAPDARVTRMEYRAHRPLFDTEAFTVNGMRQGTLATLWAATGAGAVAMTAGVNIG